MTVLEATTSLVEMTINKRAADIRARREYLGMSRAALAKRAGVDRGKLQRFEDGKDDPSDRWIGGVERALDMFEVETGHEAREGAEVVSGSPHIVRFEVQGVYGAKALIVEGPVEDLPALEAAVDRIMRRLAGEQKDAE
jgi:predicted transcriptional regulator